MNYEEGNLNQMECAALQLGSFHFLLRYPKDASLGCAGALFWPPIDRVLFGDATKIYLKLVLQERDFV